MRKKLQSILQQFSSYKFNSKKRMSPSFFFTSLRLHSHQTCFCSIWKAKSVKVARDFNSENQPALERFERTSDLQYLNSRERIKASLEKENIIYLPWNYLSTKKNLSMFKYQRLIWVLHEYMKSAAINGKSKNRSDIFVSDFIHVFPKLLTFTAIAPESILEVGKAIIGWRQQKQTSDWLLGLSSKRILENARNCLYFA